MSTCWQRCAAVENADVIETEESALKNVFTFCVLSIHPPFEVQHQLVKDAFQELAVANTLPPLLDLVNTPRCPGVYGWIDISKGPLIRRNLSVRMHVPLAQ